MSTSEDRRAFRKALNAMIFVEMGLRALYVWFVCTFEMFPATDYSDEPPEDVLAGIRSVLSRDVVPDSATEPKLYEQAGIDAVYWIGYRVDPEDVPWVERHLESSGFENVHVEL